MIDPLANATTLLDVLEARSEMHPERTWLHLYARDRLACTLTYADLRSGAEAWAAHLTAHGVGSGDSVALVLATERSFYEAYWGILRAGAVPVPAYPPVRMGRMEEYLQSLSALVGNAGARWLVTNSAIRPLIRPVEKGVERPLLLIVPDEVKPGGASPQVRVDGGDLGLLQYTSGSTGSQKGVMLSHANLIANLRAIGASARLQEDDVAVSWLPLYHDMGLIGLMLGTFYWGLPLVAMSPVDFLRRPGRWLRAISEHRGTVSAGPNFAYSLVARKMREAEAEDLDLSSWRLALCGAEPIYPATVERFTHRFSARGFRPEAFFPAYGLAENTLAVTFSELGHSPRMATLDADLLEREGRAVPARDGGGRSMVSVGRPIPTVEVEVVDDEDRPLAEGMRGEVVVRGPSVMVGYLNSPDATAETLRGGWLHTGDLGFRLDGHLFISGRKKDMVIKAGRNYFAEDLEAAAAGVPQVRPGGLCVFAAESQERGTEEVVLVAEVRGGQPSEGVSEMLRRRVSEATGCRPDRILLVPERTLPKTSSGKIQRFKTRSWYLDGSLAGRGGERRTTGVWEYLKAWLKDKLT